jgi:predicted NBD/HSP70 family sugar kinase
MLVRGMRHVFGIDLGGSNVRVLLADEAGRAVHEATEPTAAGSAGAVMAQIEALCRGVTAAAGAGPASLVAAGLGAPGVIDAAGGLGLAPNLPAFDEDVVLADVLGRRLGVPVVVDNDVNMATLGEHRHGAGRGHAHLAFLAVGTGVGMGFIAGGRLQRGASGAAGEIAALPLGADPFDPRNQVRGPLEEAASGSGIAARYEARTGTRREAEEIFARAEAGDAQAQGVLHDQAVALAMGVLAVHAILDPSLVVLGGGIGSRPDLRDAVERTLDRLTTRPVALVSSLLASRAGVVGAAEAALRHAGIPERRAAAGAA